MGNVSSERHGRRLAKERRGAVMELQSIYTRDGYQLRHVEKVEIAADELHQRHHIASPTFSTTSTASSCIPSSDISINDFEMLKVIGAGSMGKVLLVRKKSSDTLYAMKVVAKATVDAEQIWSERDVLGGTMHPCLVHLHWAFQTPTKLFLVMEYCPGGELSMQIQQSPFGRFVQPIAMFYAAEIVLALEHLHRHGIVYRDLKPENLLLSSDGHLKLVDFGLAKFGIVEPTNGTKSICGSFEYLAPEVWDNNAGYGTAVDWYAFGCVLYEMLTGLPPWYTEEAPTYQTIKFIRNSPLSFPSYVSPAARHLIRNLLVSDPTQRLGTQNGANDIKQHPFFATIDWVALSYGELTAPLDPCEDPTCINEALNFEHEFTNLPVDSSWTSEHSNNHSDDEIIFHGFSFEASILHP